jgi:hypothetical protein
MYIEFARLLNINSSQFSPNQPNIVNPRDVYEMVAYILSSHGNIDLMTRESIDTQLNST